jgi:hypothetical protein
MDLANKSGFFDTDVNWQAHATFDSKGKIQGQDFYFEWSGH